VDAVVVSCRGRSRRRTTPQRRLSLEAQRRPHLRTAAWAGSRWNFNRCKTRASLPLDGHPPAPGRRTAGPSALQTIAKAQRLLTVRARLATCDASWLRIGPVGLRGGTSFGRCSSELWLHLRCGQISSSEDVQPPDLGNAAQYPKTLSWRNPIS
jgi:hypothetical protein